MKLKITVKHENGYQGCLYGKSSMSIFYEGKEVLHTAKRKATTEKELYAILDEIPEFMDKIEK